MREKNWLEHMLSAAESVIFVCIFIVVGAVLFAFGMVYSLWNIAFHLKNKGGRYDKKDQAGNPKTPADDSGSAG